MTTTFTAIDFHHQTPPCKKAMQPRTIMKTAIKLKTKEEKALEMLSRMNILG
jgi:hypothetical protein